MKKLGRIVEVYIPNDDDLTKIGFKIKIDDMILDIIQEQNLDNAKIYRDDFVLVNVNNGNYSIDTINSVFFDDDIYE